MSKDKTGNWFTRHKILTTVLGLIVLIILVSAMSSGDSKTPASNNTSNSENSDEEQAKTAKIGETANDGKFAFTVKSFDCGATTVGTEYFESTAQGQFCTMEVSVKNIGDEAQTFDSTNQYAFNGKGQKYSANSEASYNANLNEDGSSDAFLNQINPGNKVTGKVVFDVPKGAKIVSTELHDSAFSSGVKVKLQ